MSKPKVLLTRHIPQAAEDRMARTYDLTVHAGDDPLTADEWTQAMTGHDALCTNPRDKVNAGIFATPNARVRIMANYGAGYEGIDVDAARRAGIVVTNTPDAVTAPTADLALMLMLMASRRAGEGERELRAGQWGGWLPGANLGQSLSGKLLGLVGFGRIAQATAYRAQAVLGMRVAYFSRNRAAPEVEAKFGATYYPALEALAADADVLSVHTPGGAATRHIINAERLALMKPTAILINTSRGSTVDEAALAQALAARRIYAAGLDVYEVEPCAPPDLIGLENVVLLPHIGSATVEDRIAMGMQSIDNLDAFFAGLAPPNRVA